MAQYFPKSQITSNQYTNGEEYIVASTGEEYIGDYYLVSNGSTYSGISPNNGNSSLLIPIPKSTIADQHGSPLDNVITVSTETNPNMDIETNFKLVDEYNLISTFKSIPRYIPIAQNIPPTALEYSNGKFIRYFCKRNNEDLYFEINKKTFTDLKNKSTRIAHELYTPIFIPWMLTGDEKTVFEINKTVVFFEEKNNGFFNFSFIFKNEYSRYYLGNPLSPSNIINYTKGGEFLLPNRTSYIGYYHQMENGAYMTGKSHGSGNDTPLIPLNQNKVTLSPQPLPTRCNFSSSRN